MSEPAVLDVAFVVPQSGTSGIYGPSCEASARLAVSEVNRAGGSCACAPWTADGTRTTWQARSRRWSPPVPCPR